MVSGQNDKYRLVFDGPVDEAPETMRKLKAALIVDLNLSIEQAQEILQGSTTEILTGSTELELKEGFDALRRAGGKVMIVQPESEESDGLFGANLKLDEEEEEITFIKVKKEPPAPKPIDDIEIDFSFEDEEEEQPKLAIPDTPPAPQAKKDIEILLPNEDKPLFAMSDKESEDDMNLQEEDEAPIIPKALRDRAPKSQSISDDLSLSFADAPEETHVPSSPITKTEPVVSESIAIAFEADDKRNPHAKPREKISVPADALAVLEGLAPLIEEPEPVTNEDVPSQSEEPVISADIPLASLKKKAKLQPVPQDQSEDVSPETLETPQKENTKSTKKSKSTLKRHSMVMEYLLPIGLGAIVLVVGNYLLNSPSETKSINFAEITQSLTGLATQAKSQDEKSAKPKNGTKFIGRQQYDNRSLDVDFTLSDDSKSITAAFRFETPKPEELSKEQVGRKEKQIPWVRKIDVDKTTFELSATGAFEGQAPARIYLEDAGETQRFVGTAKISGSINPEKDSSTAEVRINYQSESESGPFMIKRKKEGDYSLHIAGEITARRVE